MLAIASKSEHNKEKGGDTMANTSAVYARIDTNLKENAESILSQLGISPSSAIQMLYSQIVLKKGMPFLSLIHISEPTRRTPISYAVFCLKKKKEKKRKKRKEKTKKKI